MTSSLTTALEEMTINNEQLRREIDVLKTDVTELRTNIDAMKDENKQLTTLLDKMAVNNENQIQQINPQSSENATMKDENVQLNIDLKACHVDTSRSLHPPPVPPRRQQLQVSQWSGIT